MLSLGLPGFAWKDLQQPARLADLLSAFDADLRAADPALAQRYLAWRGARGEGLSAPDTSKLMIDVGRHVSRFVGKLFGVERELATVKAEHEALRPLQQFKREFIVRRVFKKGRKDVVPASELPALEEKVRALLAAERLDREHDREKAVAALVVRQLAQEKELAAKPAGTADAALGKVRDTLAVLDRWCFARASDPAAKKELEGWVTFRLPAPTDYGKLVELKRPQQKLPELFEAPSPHHLRRRDGFSLTDRRWNQREVMDHVDYCMLCHEREKDSCSVGFKEKPGSAQPFKQNPLGITLNGCPLEERIGEMHALKGEGDPLGALAMICVDNPMLPGTGHRICNDCMKACIYQKQEPVNIPQIETRVLSDVLELPWGFEIYSLLTRWNPLNARRPHALPYNGKNVLVVGLGPAGYTLAHHLMNDGFGVVGVDGLKIEPLPAPWLERPIHAYKEEMEGELADRVLAGFGGVSEYGITVRWDKNFLNVVYLNLARRPHVKIYGGIRFGGTLTLADAWSLGFDHVAVAAGAGKPTIVPMKNNLIRGIRKASDFLMALQLTGAYKKSALANLQVRLPAVVVGGGLTGIDTATELFAYYPVQVEKVLDRHEELVKRYGEERLKKLYSPEEGEILAEFLVHGRAVRAERQRAKAAGEAPDFVPLIQGWGGVSLVYRKSLGESPAYRLNHEEVIKSLEEGIYYVENHSPVEAVPDQYGAVKAMRFEKKGTKEIVELPARTVCVAAGTSPNTMYEKEFPGTFKKDADDDFFQAFDTRGEAKVAPWPKGETGFFTSHVGPQGQRVSYYGDNHPQYAGSVVKAMASAKDGHAHVSKLFEAELAKLDPKAQPARDARWQKLAALLDDGLCPRVVAVNRLTPTIVEVVVRAPFAAERFLPGQFYRLQNFETSAKVVHGTKLTMEGLALTGAWTDKKKGLLGLIVLEMGASSRLVAALAPGEPVVVMGPTGAPTHIARGETVVLCGGGLGNAVLFSIARALKDAGCKVVYFAGYKKPQDVFKVDEIEAGTDQIVWSVDAGEAIKPRRPQDRSFVGNIVQAMLAYAKGDLGDTVAPLKAADRIIAIGSDRMMAAVKAARFGVLAPFLKEKHEAIGSINSPMQCMMKEICAQCLCKHVDAQTGKEKFVFSCFNQDQKLDEVDFPSLNERLKANGVLEKLANLWLERLLEDAPGHVRV